MGGYHHCSSYYIFKEEAKGKMKSKKERLEVKIVSLINKIRISPIEDKLRYSVKLEKCWVEYKDLTGEDYRIQ